MILAILALLLAIASIAGAAAEYSRREAHARLIRSQKASGHYFGSNTN